MRNCKIKSLLVLSLFPIHVFADFTEETLDLSLACKGKGEFYDYKNKTTTPITANDNLTISTNNQGRKNMLEYKESEFSCITKKTEITCFNQNQYKPNYKRDVAENPFLIKFGKIVINRLTGEAISNYSYEYGNFKINFMCQKGEVKF